MDSSKLSEEVLFRLKDPNKISEDTVIFSEGDRAKKPSVEQLSHAVTGIQLSYANSEDQDRGITAIKDAFRTDDNGIINRLPRQFSFKRKHGFGIMKFDTSADQCILDAAMKSGMSGYWNASSFIVVSSPEYTALLENSFRLIKKGNVKFALRKNRNLVICEV